MTDPMDIRQMAADYDRLPSREFDTKYQGWADDPDRVAALVAEYERRDAEAKSSTNIPTRPQWPGWDLHPDPRHVEPEPVRRVPYHARPASQSRSAHAFALVGLGICLGIILFALVWTVGRTLDAAPSSGQTTDPIDVSRASSAALSGASHSPGPSTESSRSTAGTGVAPLPPLVTPVPSPTGEIGTALIGGWATYYATCSDCAAAGPLLQAALGPEWQGQTITVVSDHGQVDLRLVTSCACGDRTRNGVTRPTIIDVSLEAFGELSPAPAGSATDPGYVQVSIEIGGAGRTLPPTDLPPHPDDERMRLEVRGDELYR